MKNDINTNKTIRVTDNTPKESDDFQKIDQYRWAMTEEEIEAKISELVGDEGMA